MFNRKEHIAMMRSVMRSNWTEDQYEKDADFMEEKYSHLKEGDDVVHLDYIGSLISKQELKEIEDELLAINYRLSSFDDSGRPKASYQELISEVSIYLNNSIVQSVLLGILTNAAWDGLKILFHNIWLKIQDRKHTVIHSGHMISENRSSFSIKASIIPQTTIEFKTDNLTKESFEESLDKMRSFAKEASENLSHGSQIAIYSHENARWEILEITPDFLRKATSKTIRTLPLDDYIKEKKLNNTIQL